MGLLPTEKTKVVTQDPKNLILFGLPKCGKTSNLSQLPNNLIVDLEKGTKYVSGYVVEAETITDLYKIAKELATTDHDFKFVTIDTVTALEDISCELACKRYKETVMGKNWEGSGSDILKLPNGSGS